MSKIILQVSLYEYSAREDAAASSQYGGTKTMDQYYRLKIVVAHC